MICRLFYSSHKAATYNKSVCLIDTANLLVRLAFADTFNLITIETIVIMISFALLAIGCNKSMIR